MKSTIVAFVMLLCSCQSDFDALLQRDLKSYFAASEVKVELLRREPTQSGIAYPKFYAWVNATRPGKSPLEGAVRVAAIDDERFEVTHFLPIEEIRANPSQVDAIFPAALCPIIKGRAQ